MRGKRGRRHTGTVQCIDNSLPGPRVLVEKTPRGPGVRGGVTTEVVDSDWELEKSREKGPNKVTMAGPNVDLKPCKTGAPRNEENDPNTRPNMEFDVLLLFDV